VQKLKDKLSEASEAHRSGEIGAVPMRSDRFFAVNSSWYFATREGASVGPFETKEKALGGLDDFIEFVKLAGPAMRDSFTQSLRTA